MWLSTMTSSLLTMVAAGVLGVVALVLGIRAILALRRARMAGLLLVVVIVSLGLNLLLLLSSAAQLVFWQEYLEFAACMKRAITNSARQVCTGELERALTDRAWSSLVG